MSDVPAGWYPDPQPPVPGQAPQQRYWDGAAWTGHVAPLHASASQAPASQYPGQAAAQPAAYGSAYGQTRAYGAPVVATTPDGQPLAGWWQRVAATLIDLCILIPVVTLLTIPLWPRMAEVFGDYVDEVERAMQSGGPGPSPAAVQGDLGSVFAIIGLIQLVVFVVYQVVFLMWKQATVGKLALGLRVRRRDVPGPMPLGTVLRCTAVKYAGYLVALVPFVGTVGSLFTLLDRLWPLWDGQKQSLHDKAAGTNVVRTR